MRWALRIEHKTKITSCQFHFFYPFQLFFPQYFQTNSKSCSRKISKAIIVTNKMSKILSSMWIMRKLCWGQKKKEEEERILLWNWCWLSLTVLYIPKRSKLEKSISVYCLKRFYHENCLWYELKVFRSWWFKFLKAFKSKIFTWLIKFS